MLRAVSDIVAAHPGFEGMVRALAGRETVVLEGPTAAYRAALLARIQKMVDRPLAVVLPQDIDREAFLLHLLSFHWNPTTRPCPSASE